jgi:hypothetical protein
VYGTRFAAHQFYIRTSPVKFLRILRCSSKATTRHRVFILAKIYLMSQRLCFLRGTMSAKKFAQTWFME